MTSEPLDVFSVLNITLIKCPNDEAQELEILSIKLLTA
jgi:hypothetical protein